MAPAKNKLKKLTIRIPFLKTAIHLKDLKIAKMHLRTIKNNVKIIDSGAFKGCKNLPELLRALHLLR